MVTLLNKIYQRFGFISTAIIIFVSLGIILFCLDLGFRKFQKWNFNLQTTKSIERIKILEQQVEEKQKLADKYKTEAEVYKKQSEELKNQVEGQKQEYVKFKSEIEATRIELERVRNGNTKSVGTIDERLKRLQSELEELY